MFFWYAFIGPLVKGSNRYHDGRACFCHDTSPIWHEKALFRPMIGQVLYIDGKKQQDRIKHWCEISGINVATAKQLHKELRRGKSFCV